jgi:hypothetical protein
MNRTKAIKEFYLHRAVGGSAALHKSPAEVQHATALSKYQIAYWKRKVVDEDFLKAGEARDIQSSMMRLSMSLKHSFGVTVREIQPYESKNTAL